MAKSLPTERRKKKKCSTEWRKKYCSDFVKCLRERQEYEVLNQNGICLIRGFISDDGSKPFKANTGVRFVSTRPICGWKYCMARCCSRVGQPCSNATWVSEKSALAKIFKITGYRNIRQGKRNINGMSGTEKLIKLQGQ